MYGSTLVSPSHKRGTWVLIPDVEETCRFEIGDHTSLSVTIDGDFPSGTSIMLRGSDETGAEFELMDTAGRPVRSIAAFGAHLDRKDPPVLYVWPEAILPAGARVRVVVDGTAG